MKKILKITMLLLACLMIVGVTDVEAQYGKKKKKKKTKEKVEMSEDEDDGDYFDESGGKFTDKLWYGGGFTLGFAGDNNTSVFGLGISPMVGYKITEKLSIGPRVVVDYTMYKTRLGGEVQRVDLVTYGGGVFGRFKAFRSIFAHVEYAVLNQAFPASNSFNDLVTFREVTNNFYIGAGYNSSVGGGLGYEILLLYNTLEPDDSIDLPIDFRIGFTWNF